MRGTWGGLRSKGEFWRRSLPNCLFKHPGSRGSSGAQLVPFGGRRRPGKTAQCSYSTSILTIDGVAQAAGGEGSWGESACAWPRRGAWERQSSTARSSDGAESRCAGCDPPVSGACKASAKLYWSASLPRSTLRQASCVAEGQPGNSACAGELLASPAQPFWRLQAWAGGRRAPSLFRRGANLVFVV